MADEIQAKPKRWGGGPQSHPELAKLIESQKGEFESSLRKIASFGHVLHSIPVTATAVNPNGPSWDNAYFSNLDAASLVGFILAYKPRKYIEIGSGNSTRFARYAIAAGELATHITSIDPDPREYIDGICDRVIRTTLQQSEQSIFDELRAGDILFFDGSHLVGMDSDVVTFFLEVLPRLASGVLVHVHDIFLPFDYPPVFYDRNYTEQYILAMFLLRSQPRIILPNYFVCTDPDLHKIVEDIFKAPPGNEDIPFSYWHKLPGVSFWFMTQ